MCVHLSQSGMSVKVPIHRFLSTTCLSAALVVTGAAWANPEGGIVSAGTATITSTGTKLDVIQTTDRAVIDWRSFNIDAGEHTQFHQPGTGSLAVNRIGSGAPSVIAGQLSANGNIVLINPNGVLFTGTSQIDVGGLIATTSNLSNDQVMAGGLLNFDQPGEANAAIINNGQISVRDAGLVGFVAPNVINNGVITAKLGKVQLASGDRATVDFYGDGLINLTVSDEVNAQLVSNTGIINAEGGTITLTAAAGQEIVNSLINVEGILNATSIGEEEGTIIISAEGSNAVAGNITEDKDEKTGNSVVLVHDALLDASGRDAGERGGNITITGDNVALLGSTTIDASGHSGASNTTEGRNISDARPDAAGGDIRIGGDYLGQGTTPTARNLYVDEGVLVLNDALETGDAGRTIFWSDDTTQFYGNVYARALGGAPVDPLTWHATAAADGAAETGDGGFVETSGKKHLDVGGYVDLTAASGDRGTYFLDPTDITIYGNVDPAFTSTDGAINLSSSLKLWLDPSDTANVILTYNTMSTTATGTNGTNTITVGSNTGLAVGARIRLGGAGSVTAASTLGADTYTITNISGTTITLSSNLTTDYTGSTLYQGYVSQLTDKSGAGSHATQSTPANIPLWISSTSDLNNMGSIFFSDATNNYLDLTTTFDTTAGNYNTIMNLMKWAGSNNRMVYGFNYLDIYIASGAIGFNAGDGDLRGVSSAPFANTWKQLTGVWHNGSTSSNLMYVDGAQQTLTCSLGTCTSTPTISNNMRISGWRTDTSLRFGGSQAEYLGYNTALSTNARHLMDQYQSAKWGIALTPPGTGASEVAQATASDGYSVFTTRYLERLSNSANISLQATNDINLDFKGDTLNFSTAGRSLTLNAGNQITTASTGTITTNNAAISLTGTNGIVIGHNFALNSAGGNITFNNAVSGAGALTINSGAGTTSFASTVGAGTPLSALTVTGPTSLNGNVTTTGNITLNSATTLGANTTLNAGTGTLALGSTLDGNYNFTATAATITSGGAWGGSTPLNAVSLTSTNSLSLPSIEATSIFARTTGGTADITLAPSTALEASASGDAITLVSARNFINSSGSATPITAPNGRWLVYSTNPASDTFASMSSDFRLFNCSYGSCASVSSTPGNGFLYSYQPTLTITPTVQNIIYGNAATLSGYSYSVSGYLGSDSSADSLTGTLTGTSTYTTGSDIGTYNLNYSSGSLASTMGYGFSYANNASGISVGQRALTVSATSTNRDYGDSNPSFTGSLSGVYSGDTITVSRASAATAGSDVGTYAITNTLNDPGSRLSNYSVTNNSGTLTINPRALTVITNSASKVLPAADPTFTGSDNLIAYDAALVSWAYAPVSYSGTAGTYTIAATATDPSSRLANYTRTNNYGLFTVTGTSAATTSEIPTQVVSGFSFIPQFQVTQQFSIPVENIFEAGSNSTNEQKSILIQVNDKSFGTANQSIPEPFITFSPELQTWLNGENNEM